MIKTEGLYLMVSDKFSLENPSAIPELLTEMFKYFRKQGKHYVNARRGRDTMSKHDEYHFVLGD